MKREDRIMYSRTFGIHGTISALIAVAILGIAALVFDRAHLTAAPAGIVEVGKLVMVEPLARH
jgi:hypothetical protein